MLSFLKSDALDWTKTDAVITAQAAYQAADEHEQAAKATYDPMWARWNVQVVPLSFNSPALPAEQAWLAAKQAKAEALSALSRAESTAKAAVFPAWRDGQHDRFEVVVDKLDALIEAFTELERWTDCGLAAQIPLLDLKIGAGQLHAVALVELRDRLCALMDKELARQI